LAAGFLACELCM